MKWKKIDKFPDYSIREDGAVRNDRTGRILKVTMSKGFKKVNLKGRNCHIHRLLAEAFIPNPYGKKIVVHVDGDKLNNNLRNLRWQDDKYNETNAGTKISLRWVPVVTRDMTEEEINDMRARFGELITAEDCWAYNCRLPDVDEEVIITTKWGVSVTTFCGDVDGYWFENYEDRGDVLAWTHLPEPYKRKEDVDNV